MANNDYVFRLTAHDNASKTLDGLKNSFKDTGNTAKSSLDDIAAKFDKLQNSTAPVKKKLGELQRLMAQMNFEGLDSSQLFTKMAIEAGSYKDAISDAAAQVRTLSTDHLYLDTAAAGLSAITGLAQTAAGAYTLLGGSENDAQKITATLVSIQSVYNGIQAITNALNKDGALMQGLKAIQTKLATSAIVSQTAATKGATIAQKAFNLACKANPYILLATAVAAAGAALYSFATNAKEAEAMEQRIIEQTQKAADEWDNYTDTVANNGGKQLATYSALKTEWKTLRTEQEKNDFIRNNASEFSNLGVEIDNVSDAENFLNTNTSKIVEAFTLRAQAAAHAAEAARLYGEYLKASENLQSKFVKAGDDSSGKAQNSKYAQVDRDGKWRFTVEGAKRYNEELLHSSAEAKALDEIQQKINKHIEEQISLQSKANNLLKSSGTRQTQKGGKTGGKTTNGKGNTEKTPIEKANESITKAEKDYVAAVQKAKDSKEKGITNDAQYAEQTRNALATLIESYLSQASTLGGIEKLTESQQQSLEKYIAALSETDDILNQRKSTQAINDANNDYIKATKQATDARTTGYTTEAEYLTTTQAALKKLIDTYFEQAASVGGIEKLTEEQKTSLQKAITEYNKLTDTIKERQKAEETAKRAAEDLASKQKSFDEKIQQSKEPKSDIASNYSKALSTSQSVYAKQFNELAKQYDDLQDMINEGLKAGIDVSEGQSQLNVLKSQLDELANKAKITLAFEGFENITNDLSSITSYADSLATLGDQWDRISEDADGLHEVLQKVGLVLNVVTGAFQTFNTIMGIVNTVTSLFNIGTTASAGAMAATTTATTAKSAADTSAAVTSMAVATALKAQESAALDAAAAMIFAAHAYIPFAGVSIASGQIGAMMGAMAAQAAASKALTAFANGGIVGGGRPHGDNILIRANSGEAVVNTRQQNRLFDLLNSNADPYALNQNNVVFKLRGQELVGLINNYTTSKKKII